MPASGLTGVGGGGGGLSAPVALSNLAAVTASRVLVSDGSGFVSASSITSTTLGYLDATSSIQTQLDGKIAKTLTTTTGDIIYASANNTPARLAIGTEGYYLKVVGGVPAWAAVAGGLSYITESLNTSSPNNTINAVVLAVTGGSTDTDLVLTPKANGALQLQVADSTSTGGNKRGTNAIDLQRSRSAASQVASGTRAVLIGGTGNTASATDCGVFAGNSNTAASNANAVVLGGTGSTASGAQAAVVGGTNNTASATNAVVIGGTSNNVSATNAVAIGASNTANQASSVVMGQYGSSREYNDIVLGFLHNSTASAGYSQGRFSALSKQTTNATPTALINGAGSLAYFSVPSYSARSFTMWVIGRSNATGAEIAAYKIDGCVFRQNAASTTALYTTVTVLHESTGTMDCVLTADTTNGGVIVTVTGVAGKNIQWVAIPFWAEITGTS